MFNLPQSKVLSRYQPCFVGSYSIIMDGMKFWEKEWNSVGDPEESISVSNSNVEPPYSVINNSNFPVYDKPEDGKASEKCIIPAGEKSLAQVDGIATVKYNNKVFKIPGKGPIRFSVVVENNGDVTFSSISSLPMIAASKIIDLISDKKNHVYGWVEEDYFHSMDDKSWDSLFSLAKTIK